jgi:hypothetical protein
MLYAATAPSTAQASFQRVVGAGVVTSLVGGLVADLVTGLLGDARSVCVKRTPFGIDPFRGMGSGRVTQGHDMRPQARDMLDVFSAGGLLDHEEGSWEPSGGRGV